MITMQTIPKILEQIMSPKRIPLDNAAKFFPGVSSRKDTWVFRLTCELTEVVDPWVLQYATEKALGENPLYQCVLHKGLFWYFLEKSKQKPVVREDRASPCSTLYDRKHKRLQFSVTYHSEHIHLEVFHALSDGVGALRFFKLLVAHYIVRKHPECGLSLTSINDELTSECGNEDSFKTYYSGSSIREALKDQETAQRGLSWTKRGYRLIGRCEPNYKIKMLAGVADSDSVVAKAREYGVTVTALLTAALMLAIQSTKPAREKHTPIVVAIPVNLRKYFLIDSRRNFFQAINVGHYFDKGADSLPEVSRQIGEQLARELTPEGLAARMNMICSLEHSPLLRLIPRQGKDIMLRLLGILGQIHTTGVSNLGKIVMPQELNRYIRLFDFTTSTTRMQLNVCSFEKQMVMNIASRLVKTEIQERFFQVLSEVGIETQITSC